MRTQSDSIHKAILDVAKDLFTLSGYEATTMDKIAKNVGVTKKTIYTRYPDKATILKSAIQVIVDSNLEPDLCKDITIRSIDDLYKELYSIAKSLNDTFAQDSYSQLIRIAISEMKTHPELKEASSLGIVSHFIEKLECIFELTNASGLTSIDNIKSASRMFVGGFLVQFYVGVLLEPSPSKYLKYSSAELSSYVDRFMQTLSCVEIDSRDDVFCVNTRAISMECK